MVYGSVVRGLTPGHWLKKYLREHRLQLLAWIVGAAASFTHLFLLAGSSNGLAWTLLGSGIVLLGGSWVVMQLLGNLSMGVIIEPLPQGRFYYQCLVVMTLTVTAGALLFGFGALRLMEAH